MFVAIGGSVEHFWLGVGSNMVYVVTNFSNDNDVDLEALSMLVFSFWIASSMKKMMVGVMVSGKKLFMKATKRSSHYETGLKVGAVRKIS